MKTYLIFIILIVSLSLVKTSKAQPPGHKSIITATQGNGRFPLAASGIAAPFYLAAGEYPGVIRAAADLAADIKAVAGVTPAISTRDDYVKQVVIVGTIGKSRAIDLLIKQKKIDATGIAGKWETYLIQVVKHPFKDVNEALVIAGSDKRGTIFGLYELSAQIGVSPWAWWADVPVKEQPNLYVRAERYTDGEPKVKYRGIFINDEAPAFSGWAHEKFGGFNHKLYSKVFELILRLKGNYLWPAMWGNAFNDDDKLNPVLADEYGIVMGTSHHEPMDRAQAEWKRYGKGEWNYQTNKAVLQDFWRKGIENMGNKETIVTIGMRGDGDMPMSEEHNISLLEKIVKDQRVLIEQVTGKPASQTPQIWALYKEVQAYYDKGMRVPDDVTLLLCDDNWGNIRKLPKPGEKLHKGGYGIYYHFDYVGDPRNYKWINTNPISRVWEQMNLAYEYNARQVWLVNVGDLKPMEFPISFFLDYAWNPEKWQADDLQHYTGQWVKQQFGAGNNTEDIARIITTYSKYNARRKPELLDGNTYSLLHYNEFENVVSEYNALKHEAKGIYEKLPAQYKDAFYQLVMHPVEASANLNELYLETAKNKCYAAQGRATANLAADNVIRLFTRDKEISNYYNKTMAGGKWNHMMDQTHIGYTYWQQPEVDKMPDVQHIKIPDKAQMGVWLEGSDDALTAGQSGVLRPQFYPYTGSHYVEIFNKGKAPFSYNITSPVNYLNFSTSDGNITGQERIWISIDWAKAPLVTDSIPITINGPDGKITFRLTLNNAPFAESGIYNEANGYIAIEADKYHSAVPADNADWKVIPHYGRTRAGVMPRPVTMGRQQPGSKGGYLNYNINLRDTGWISVEALVSPTIDFTNKNGLYYAISVDGQAPVYVNIHSDANEVTWRKNVADNINSTKTRHHITRPGKHLLKYWMVDPGVVLQKIVINAGGVRPSYLGPPPE